MKATIKTTKEVEIKTLHVEAFPRYWEDTEVNGIEDKEGMLINCREGDMWKPIIEFDSGIITNWTKGSSAKVHYKVCDAGSYFLKDADGNTVLSIEDNYVPDILCPEDEGYGDYIIMNIDVNGQIEKWKPTLKGFNEDDED